MLQVTVEKAVDLLRACRDYDISSKEAEALVEPIIKKLTHHFSISSLEKEYLELFLQRIYPRIGGELYPYPVYDEKLKQMYSDLVDWYMINRQTLTVASVKFLLYYYVTQISKENNIKPYVVFDNEYFKSRPGANAYYRREITGIGQVPYLGFNPDTIRQIVDNPDLLPTIIAAGFHEIQHELDMQEVLSEDITHPQAILWAKEYIAKQVLGTQYYILNYTNIFFERNASLKAYQRTKKIFDKYGIVLADMENINYDLTITQKENESAKDMLAVDLLDMITTDYINSNYGEVGPYKILSNVYNSNGIKKTLPQIRSELDRKVSQKSRESGEPESLIQLKNMNLLAGICQTDNDLLFQFLCEKAAQYYHMNSKDMFDSTVKRIEELLSTRDMSFVYFTQQMYSRITQLEIMLSKPISDKVEYHRLLEELKSTRFILDAAREYNPKFKEAHNTSTMKYNIRRELTKLLGKNVGSPDHVSVTHNGVIRKPKTEQEMFEEYREFMTELVNKSLNDDMKKNYEDEIKLLYSDFIDVDNLSVYQSSEQSQR